MMMILGVVVLMVCRGEVGSSILLLHVLRGSADVPCASWSLSSCSKT